MENDLRFKEGPIALSDWLASVGVTPVTGWRWRKRGWLTTINIAGRQYISAAEIQKFNTRATNGDFAKVHPAPGRTKVESGASVVTE